MLRIRRSALLGIPAVCLLTGCFGTLPTISPPAYPEPAAIPAAAESHLSVPLAVSLNGVQRALDAMVPRIIQEDDGHDCTEYGIYKGGPVSIVGQGPVVVTTAQIEYRAKGHWPNAKPFCGPSVSCGYGESARRINAVFRTSIEWTPEWGIKTVTTARPDPIDRCDLTLARIDATHLVVEKSQGILDNIAQQLDQRVPQLVNIRPLATRAWDQLNRPIKIADGAWLVINPKAAQAQSPTGKGLTETFAVALTASPALTLAQSEPSSQSTPLPPLKIAPVDPGLHVEVMGTLPYDYASQKAETDLVGREYVVAGKKERISKARVYGAGAKVILQIDVKGDADGTLYLAGTPIYFQRDVQGRTELVELPDLDYTVETRNVLVKAADWLLHKDFVESIRAAAAFPLQTTISEGQALVTKAINRQLVPGVTLSGNVTSMRVAGIATSSDALHVYAVLDGTANVAVSTDALAMGGSQ